MSKIKISFDSPFFVGGIRLKENVLSSIEYIPGSVMRASMARYILMNCPLFDPAKPDSEGRYNYVYVRDESKCKNCSFFEVCNSFSDISFSFFYPEGFEILPATARGCKYSKNHGFKDLLTFKDDMVCSVCKGENSQEAIDSGSAGRMESVGGFRIGNERGQIKRISITRTAIDRYTHTALDGTLHTIELIDQGYCYEGEIKGFEKEWLDNFESLAIGKYSSIGFGKAKIIDICDKADYKEDYGEKIIEFNKNLRDKEDDKIFVPMTFQSDARLGIEEKNIDKPLSGKEYKEIWKQLLFKDDDLFEVEKVYADNYIYRGFDTSRRRNKREKDPLIQTAKGSVLLLSFKCTIDEALSKIKSIESEGVGKDRKDGYGRVKFLDELHVKGEIL